MFESWSGYDTLFLHYFGWSVHLPIFRLGAGEPMYVTNHNLRTVRSIRNRYNLQPIADPDGNLQ